MPSRYNFERTYVQTKKNRTRCTSYLFFKFFKNCRLKKLCCVDDNIIIA